MSKKPGKSHGLVTLSYQIALILLIFEVVYWKQICLWNWYLYLSWYFTLYGAKICFIEGFMLIFRVRTVAGETRVVAKMWDWANISKFSNLQLRLEEMDFLTCLKNWDQPDLPERAKGYEPKSFPLPDVFILYLSLLPLTFAKKETTVARCDITCHFTDIQKV